MPTGAVRALSVTAGATREVDRARPLSPRAPAPIARRGYHAVFRDDFNRFRPPVWSRSIWYESPAAAGDIFTYKGVLHLVSRRARGYPNISVTTLKSQSFRRGYFEARMRWTRGNGAWPAFWLFATKHARGIDCPPLTSELDVFEGQGSEPHVYYGTVHRNTNGLCGIPDSQNVNNWHPSRCSSSWTCGPAVGLVPSTRRRPARCSWRSTTSGSGGRDCGLRASAAQPLALSANSEP